jgi:hypothetical protein
MFNLNEFIKKAMPQSRREFLTYSSASIIAMAASSVFPAPVKAASLLFGHGTVDLITLDNIDFYVDKSTIVPDANEIKFDQPTDEALYYSHVLFQELMKKEFKSQQSGLAGELGLNPNTTILALSDNHDSLLEIHREYNDFFSENVAEYISSLLQNSYSSLTDVEVKNRIAYNSWDMIKVNAQKQVVEKGETFRVIMDRLYAIATASCQGGALQPFKASNWARQLMEHYQQSDTLSALTADLQAQAQEPGQSSFTAALHKVYNTFHKVRALNYSAPADQVISEESLRDFERMLYGAVYSGLAMSMSWGSRDVENTVLSRNGSFDDVADYLQREDLTGSSDVSEYWKAFFSTTAPSAFWSGIKELNFSGLTLGNSVAHNKIIEKFPALNENSRGRGDMFVSGFAMLLALSHFSWATISDREEDTSPLAMAELGVGLFSDGIIVVYEMILTRLTTMLFGNEKPLTDAIVNSMSKFGRFMRNLCTQGRVDFLLSPERKVAEKLFMGFTGIKPIIEKCFVALSALGAAFAAYSLAQAIEGGVVADIVFASINMFLAAATFALSVAAVLGVTTGPLGLVIAVVGIIIALAQWIYSLLHKEPIPPTPIQSFTRIVMEPADFIHPDSGDFICKSRDTWGAYTAPFNTRTMNTDWQNLATASNKNFPQRGALLTSSNGGIYYFGDLKYATYRKNAKDIFGNGADPLERIPHYNPPFQFESGDNCCDFAVESRSQSGDTKILFSARCGDSDVPGSKYQPRLFVSPSVDVPPTNVCVSDGVITNINEVPLDIAAINELEATMFIVFTRRSIYQLKGRDFKIVIPRYGNLPEDQANRNMFSFITSVVIDQTIHLFYAFTDDYDGQNLYHYTLDRDDNGDYTKLELLQTMSKKIMEGASNIFSIVGTKYPATNDLSARITFFAAGGSKYKRFGTIEVEGQNNYGEKETSLMPLYDGVIFSMPGSFEGFYKNAYIPK